MCINDSVSVVGGYLAEPGGCFVVNRLLLKHDDIFNWM